jgi:hypothetical protein
VRYPGEPLDDPRDALALKFLAELSDDLRGLAEWSISANAKYSSSRTPARS